MILKNKQKSILNQATEFFGLEQRNKKTVEELAELIKEVIKDRKDYKLRRVNIIDEVADSLIMIQNQILIHGVSKDELSNRISYKINRLKNIMKRKQK